MDSNICIQCSELSKLYKQGDNTIYAINNCNIKIRTNEFNAVIGKSGSGKSTLLNLIAGYIRPTKGTVLFNNKDINQMNDSQLAKLRSTGFGFIFQSYHLFPILTAKENIMFAVKDSSAFSKHYFDSLCSILDISDRLEHLPSELSGGQQQRVAIARALINRPPVLLADEPTGNLDKGSAEALTNYLKTIHQEFNTTIIVATHDHDLANSASRIFEVDNGFVREK